MGVLLHQWAFVQCDIAIAILSKSTVNKQFDFGFIRPMYYFFGVSTFLGVVFSFVSNNEQSYFIFHLALWILQTLGPVVILVYCHVLFHKSRFFDKQNPWLKLFVSGLAGSVLFSPIALGLDFLWLNEALPSQLPSLMAAWVDEFIAITPPITLSWIAINAPWLLGLRFAKQNKDNDPANKEPSASNYVQEKPETEEQCSDGFATLLMHTPLCEILYIQSELHYLSVVGQSGRELILYNLKDAIAEMPRNLGIQTHRSYWVSYDNIIRLSKDGRQGSVVMKNGDKVPVSRSKFDTIKSTLDSR
jgi:hypothetical protein